jgi:hypothetical protein
VRGPVPSPGYTVINMTGKTAALIMLVVYEIRQNCTDQKIKGKSEVPRKWSSYTECTLMQPPGRCNQKVDPCSPLDMQRQG